MKKSHYYFTNLEWTGNSGQGTPDYRGYERSHIVSSKEKLPILCSSDPSFRGDSSRYNPEELLVSSLSACHMLWFLHLCAESGVSVISYKDNAEGEMRENRDGSGEFVRVILKPKVAIRGEKDITLIDEMHLRANSMCFIARSVKFPVLHIGECTFIIA